TPSHRRYVRRYDQLRRRGPGEERMNTLLTSLATGLGQGAAYALIAVSFVIIYRATGVLTFAQPALLILGTFSASVLATNVGVPFWFSVIGAMVIVAALSVVIERVAIRPMV